MREWSREGRREGGGEGGKEGRKRGGKHISISYNQVHKAYVDNSGLIYSFLTGESKQCL